MNRTNRRPRMDRLVNVFEIRDDLIVTALLGRRIDLAGGEGVRFDCSLSAVTCSWLPDYRVHQTVVLPGGAFQELAFSAAREFYGTSSPIELLDFRVHRPLAFPDESEMRQVQVALKPESKGVHAFEVYSRLLSPGRRHEGASDRWAMHATGRLISGRHKHGAMHRHAYLAALREQFTAHELCTNEIYRTDPDRELDLGPSFQVTDDLWRDGAAVLAKLSLPQNLRAQSSGHCVHPVLLEACFQALTLTYPQRTSERGYVLSAADSVLVERSAGAEVWCHARLRSPGGTDPEIPRADIDVMAPDGTQILSMRGVVLTPPISQGNSCARPPAAPDPFRSRPRRITSLTYRQRQVARLVGLGKTNREIATELFISMKTVEYHLGQVYLQLGIAGRRALRDLVQIEAAPDDASSRYQTLVRSGHDHV
ncbi:polyketide synthase dehydratase domain-containing protein [Streptomyces sp. NPDC005125]